VAGLIRRWANEAPNAPALTYQGHTDSWDDVYVRSCKTSRALEAAGVGRQDRVAVLDKNTPAHFDVLFGASLLNAVYVAVNWRLAPPEMAHILNDAEAKVLVVGAEFLPQLAAFEDQLRSVTRIVIAGGGHDKHPSLADWQHPFESTDPGAQHRPEDVAVQLYTSGTTGLPKGAMLTNLNMGVSMSTLGAELGANETSVNLVAMPLFHIGGSGWALAGMTVGAHTVLLPQVDPDEILSLIPRYQVTHTFVVPAVLMFLLNAPAVGQTDFSSLTSILYGAAPISDDVLRRCLEVMGCAFTQVYGLTETTGAITILRADQHDADGIHRHRLRSCGVPYSYIELRIVNAEDGSNVATGEVGEIWTRSAQNMLGYWNKPEETARTITPDGWLRTGDAGFVDGDGFVYLHDRIKDMIVSGGENIYPAEVENVLMSHPAVADVAVIGVPSERWGETVKAVVVFAPGTTASASELIEHCRLSLAHFKCPTSVDAIDVLPRNPSGKILKRELREPFWVGHERRVN